MPKLEPQTLAERAGAVVEKTAPGALLDSSIFDDAVTITVDKKVIVKVIEALRADKELCFDALSDVTAIDFLESGREPRFDVVYHLMSYEHFHFLCIHCPVGEDAPEVDSLCHLWQGASFMERELWDMFGIRSKGTPDPSRVLMPENWEGHPLRKDFPLGGATSFYYKQDTNEYAGEPDDMVPRIRVQEGDV